MIGLVALAAGASPAFDAFVARIDADGDGVVSPAEYAPAGEPDTFDGIDTDADGRLSIAELEAWFRVTPPRPVDVVPSLVRAVPPPPGQARAEAVAPAAVAETGFVDAVRARVGDRLLPFVGLVAVLLLVLLADIARMLLRRRR